MTIYIPLYQRGSISSFSLPDRVDYFLYMGTSIELVNSKITMSSLEIAELTGKVHKNVARDIREAFDEEIRSAQIGAYLYKDSMNRNQEAYMLDKEQCLVLLSGYSIALRKKIIHRWQQLENAQQPKLPTTFVEALELLVASEKEKILIEAERNEAIRTKQLISDSKTAKALGKVGGLTTENKKLKTALTESEKKAIYYEKQAEENKKVFWWNK